MMTQTAAAAMRWIDSDPPPAAILGLRFGHGPAATADLLAEAAAAAGLPPQVTMEAARQFHVDYNSNVASDPVFWRAAANAYRRAALRRRVEAALAAPSGFGERLFAFWTDHFTTVPRSPHYMPMQVSMTDEAVRPHIAGRFADMLKAATLHPMMLVYLDQNSSVGDHSAIAAATPGAGLNENLARELLELHTLGVDGPYSQDDVRETANLLAGMIYRIYRGVGYEANRAEPGVETILGADYPQDSLAEIHRMLEALAAHPATARHLAQKLAVHFIADAPSEALVGLMAGAYLETGGQLPAVYEVMLHALVNREPVRQKLRQPLEWIIASLRAIGVSAAEIAALPDSVFDAQILNPLARLGQPFEQAPGPDGWEEDARHWVGPQPLAARLVWARSAPAAILNALGRELPDPAAVIAGYYPIPSGPTVQWSPRAETRQAAIASILCAPEMLRR